MIPNLISTLRFTDPQKQEIIIVAIEYNIKPFSGLNL